MTDINGRGRMSHFLVVYVLPPPHSTQYLDLGLSSIPAQRQQRPVRLLPQARVGGLDALAELLAGNSPIHTAGVRC